MLFCGNLHLCFLLSYPYQMICIYEDIQGSRFQKINLLQNMAKFISIYSLWQVIINHIFGISTHSRNMSIFMYWVWYPPKIEFKPIISIYLFFLLCESKHMLHRKTHTKTRKLQIKKKYKLVLLSEATPMMKPNTIIPRTVVATNSTRSIPVLDRQKLIILPDLRRRKRGLTLS